jgi:hypothetical protein
MSYTLVRPLSSLLFENSFGLRLPYLYFRPGSLWGEILCFSRLVTTTLLYQEAAHGGVYTNPSGLKGGGLICLTLFANEVCRIYTHF